MDKPTSKHPLQIILEESGYECRSYSGRGMYGKYCLGVDIPNGKTIGTLIGECIESSQNFDGCLLSIIANSFLDMRQDSMGLGTILYFPGVDFFGTECEDEIPPLEEE